MSKTRFLILSLIAVIGSCFTGIVAYRIATGSLPWEHNRACAGIEAACEIHLQNAERKAAEAISNRAAEFSTFIESRKSGAKPFSRDMVSFKGQWRVLKPRLPFTDPDGHTKYVIETFNRHIFSSEDFSNAMKRSIEGGIKDIERIENELAIALRREILGKSLGPEEIQKAEVEFQDAIAHLLPEAKKGAGTAAGSFVGSEAATLATQVLSRLGVSAGFLAAGAYNSWWTFGGSVVIGLAVAEIWDWFTKPAERIEEAMVAELEKLSRNGSDAIQNELSKVVEERSPLWRKAI